MTEKSDHLNKLISMIIGHLSNPVTPDHDTISFIRSAYGVNEPDEIVSFIKSGDDNSSVLEMIFYPADEFRRNIEKYIPADGLSADEIDSVSKAVSDRTINAEIFFQGRKLVLSAEDSSMCKNNFLAKLNLSIPFTFLSGNDSFYSSDEFFWIRSLLRKGKYTFSPDNSQFVNDLITGYCGLKTIPSIALAKLIGVAAGFLNGKDQAPLDILAGRKFFYENAIIDSAEFARMIKTYSMEFIMMKRIQPPLIPEEECLLMIESIDSITSIACGILLPSVRELCAGDYE